MSKLKTDHETRHLDDYFDHQRQSSIDYEAEGSHIRKRFTLEYCDDPKKLDRVDLIGPKGLDYDDVFNSIIFEERDEKFFNAFDGIVMEMYLHYLFSDEICAVKLFEQIYNGDELLQERWFEFPSTFRHEMAKLITQDITINRDRLRKEVDDLTKEVTLQREFIKKYHAEEAYKEFREENAVR